MTPLREAIVLPLVFLTVTLLGGLGPGATFAAPSPFSLVMAVMIVAALVRSGALVPERLLHQGRPILANANGILVLISLFAAASSMAVLLTPQTGLPRLFVSIFLFALVLNTLVALPDRVRVLRSLAVVLMAAYVVKFVVLAGLSEPGASRTSRVVGALFDAVTLGAVVQEPQPASAAYLAFAAIALFLIGAAALPARRDRVAGGELVVRDVGALKGPE
jgi:hypothetical protein